MLVYVLINGYFSSQILFERRVWCHLYIYLNIICLCGKGRIRTFSDTRHALRSTFLPNNMVNIMRRKGTHDMDPLQRSQEAAAVSFTPFSGKHVDISLHAL